MDNLKKDFASKLLKVKAIILSHGLRAGIHRSIATIERHCHTQTCATM